MEKEKKKKRKCPHNLNWLAFVQIEDCVNAPKSSTIVVPRPHVV